MGGWELGSRVGGNRLPRVLKRCGHYELRVRRLSGSRDGVIARFVPCLFSGDHPLQISSLVHCEPTGVGFSNASRGEENFLLNKDYTL